MVQQTFRHLNRSGRKISFKQSGFSIVELMVSILIGLIIMAGVVQVVVTSRTTYVGQEDMSFIQENARYAMDVLGKDIQGAGYRGCAGQGARTALIAQVPANAAEFIGLGALQGFGTADDGAPDAYRENRASLADNVFSESILIRRFAGAERPIASHTGTTITLAGQANFLSDNLGIVGEDCRRIGVFRGQVGSSESGDITIGVSATPNNNITSIKPSLDRDIICPGAGCASYTQNYNPGAVVMDYVARAYYIGTSDMVPGVPALMRAALRNGTVVEEEIALGVEDMHLRYAVRANNGNLRYFSAAELDQDANANWDDVIAVEVQLLFRSQTPSAPNEVTQTIGGRVHATRHMRQIVTSTFNLRNRS